MKKATLVLAIFIILSISTGCSVPVSSGEESTSPPQDFTGMGNPSAVYCQELGYQFKIVTDAQGERGVCTLPGEQECGSWEFLQGECGIEHGYCAQQGLDTVVKHDGKNGLTQSYAVCVDENQEEIGTAVEMMDLEEKSLGCGVGLEETRTLDASGEEPVPPLDFIPPTSFDWRSYSGGDWLTQVKNQGSCGSCWAFAAVGVTESVINIALGDPTVDLDLSEQYLVADCQVINIYQNCCGGYKDQALYYVRDSGIPDEDCMTYIDGGSCTCDYDTSICDANCTYRTNSECSDRECADRCGDWDSRLAYIQDYGYLGYWAADSTMKQYLVDYGPLAVSVGIGTGVGGGFGQTGYDPDVYSCVNDTDTGHAVVVVGYDDAGGYWIVRNSWGHNWGYEGDGYYKVAYGECAVNKYPYYAFSAHLNWHVSPIGNDSNNCLSIGTSCLTIQGAIDKASDGDAVHVAAGAYNENIIMKSGVDVIGNSPADTSIVGTASIDGVVNFDDVTQATLQKFKITVATPDPGIDRGVVFEGSTDSTAAIKNSIITNTQYGIYVKYPSSPTIENNTLAADSDEQGILIGTVTLATNPVIKNNIIDGYSYGGIQVISGTIPPLPVITYNDLWNNGTNYVNYPDQTGFNGNISADPDFADPDYHLTGSSAAINAGDPASDYSNEPAPNGGRINMGAYGNTDEAAAASRTPLADFDGDGDTDVSVFRPSNGRWYMMGQSSVSWALTGDLPVPGDYNGDGTTDIAVYRPSNGKWYIKDQCSTSWGFSGDIPVQADYDGDGSTEIAVLRPSNGRWYIEGMGNFSWYYSGDIPVPCDYDGDGADEIAVFRPSNNKWYVMGSSPVSWAQSGDIPVPADYDGDGSCDIAVYRPSNGNWYVQGNSPVSWGYPDDIPVPGDYDGDGATEIAILRPSNGRWYIQGVGNFS